MLGTDIRKGVKDYYDFKLTLERSIRPVDEEERLLQDKDEIYYKYVSSTSVTSAKGT